MGMIEKALLEFEGKTILERLLENLFQVADAGNVILIPRQRSERKVEAGALKNSLAVKSVFALTP